MPALDLYGRELLAVDGTRIKAVNNKDRNFTRSSLREFIRRADEWLEDYLKRLDEGDVEEGATGGGAGTKNLAEKIAALNEKRGRYQAMLAQLDRTGEDQISLTDPDSRAIVPRKQVGHMLHQPALQRRSKNPLPMEAQGRFDRSLAQGLRSRPRHREPRGGAATGDAGRSSMTCCVRKCTGRRADAQRRLQPAGMRK